MDNGTGGEFNVWLLFQEFEKSFVHGSGSGSNNGTGGSHNENVGSNPFGALSLFVQCAFTDTNQSEDHGNAYADHKGAEQSAQWAMF